MGAMVFGLALVLRVRLQCMILMPEERIGFMKSDLLAP